MTDDRDSYIDQAQLPWSTVTAEEPEPELENTPFVEHPAILPSAIASDALASESIAPDSIAAYKITPDTITVASTGSVSEAAESQDAAATVTAPAAGMLQGLICTFPEPQVATDNPIHEPINVPEQQPEATAPALPIASAAVPTDAAPIELSDVPSDRETVPAADNETFPSELLVDARLADDDLPPLASVVGDDDELDAPGSDPSGRWRPTDADDGTNGEGAHLLSYRDRQRRPVDGWCIASLCAGLALIAACVIIPQADINRRLAYERQRLEQDREQIQQQVAVNAEFLRRVQDDPQLAERLAQRQMKVIRKGTAILDLKEDPTRAEMSPFLLVNVPPPAPLPDYKPIPGVLSSLCLNPKRELYVLGAAIMLVATGLVLGHETKA